MRKAEYGCAREFTEEILKQAHNVWSIDKIRNKEENTATLIVRFNDDEVKTGTFKDDYSVKRNYTLLRKECLGVAK